jgi:hypothetical protein
MNVTVSQLQQLVGNPDAYAIQHPDRYEPVRQKLDGVVLGKHLRGELTVGTYIIRPPDQAKTLVFDIDATNDADARNQTERVTDILDSIELRYGVEFSGKKGYHIWVLAPAYVPAELLYTIGRGVREEAGLNALEVFPKQTEVRELGNLVKLPGGIHVGSGARSEFITRFPIPNSVPRLMAVAKLYPEVAARKSRSVSGGEIEYPCVASIQEGVGDGGRNIHLFHLAVMLRKFSLSDENVEAVVRRANEKSDPPLDEGELESLLDNSRHSGPTCDQLNADRHCGEQCIKAKHEGLYTREGALRWAPNGDKVVMEVAGRANDGRIVLVDHPDIMDGRVALVEKGRDEDAVDAG